METNDFEINFLDHVAITVKDLDESARWYKKVLGLKKYKLEKWGNYPIFLLAGKTGVALFPADAESDKKNSKPHSLRIDHFAFNVDRENFEKAKKRYSELNLEFTVKDHFYFHSIYTEDPDGHTVELTTLVLDEDEFY